MILYSVLSFFLVSSVLGIGPGTARRGIVRPPVNEAVLAGSTVVLICEVHDVPPVVRVMWGEYITSPLGSIISDNNMILGHVNRDRYRIINNAPTEFFLEITNVSVADAGRYLCQDTHAAPPDLFRGEMELIVIESTPVCNTSAPPGNNVLEGQTHTIECTVNYGGLYPPRMTWSGPPPFEVGSPPPNPTTVWSGIRYTVDRSMDLRAYECLTNITEVPPQPEGVADNTPTYSYLFRSPQMFVFWGPKNMSATPIQPTYQPGDMITCNADSFPESSYFWQNMRTLEMYNTRFFTVPASLLGTNQTMRCQAQNLIGGFVYSDNLFIVVNVPAPTTPTTTPSTTPTTTPLPFADCSELSGYWVSENPLAELIITVVPGGQFGEVEGLIKNRTDTVWVEVVGTTRRPDYGYIGLVAIWPFEDGLTSFSGECHNCFGVERIIGNGMWRSYADSAVCGDGGSPAPYDPYTFLRRGSIRSAVEGVELDVYKPTDITTRLGVTLKKKK